MSYFQVTAVMPAEPGREPAVVLFGLSAGDSRGALAAAYERLSWFGRQAASLDVTVLRDGLVPRAQGWRRPGWEPGK